MMNQNIKYSTHMFYSPPNFEDDVKPSRMYKTEQSFC